MENQLKEKYGLFTAISMVVGIVIGSGVFFKATKVLTNTGGSMTRSLAVVIIVGLIMIICSYVFATLANRYEKVNGIIDYAEVALGPKYAYYMGWFMTIIYYPTLTATLAWVSAQYTAMLFGFDPCTDVHLAFGALFLIGGYVVNALSPKIAGYFQVTSTVIKLIPLVLMAVVGIIAGIANGMTVDAFTQTSMEVAGAGGGMMGAIVAFAFSYEGWIIATSINSELKDSKKNLPRALILGSFIVIIVYATYFIGLTGALSTDQILEAGSALPQVAFESLFGRIGGSLILVFVVISCLGTMNGLMLGCVRGLYSVSARGRGPMPKFYGEVSKSSNMPTNSAIFGLALCAIWYCQWEVCFINGVGPALIGWEPDELPIITLYAGYIPIFISLMIREKDLNVWKRFITPALGIVSCLFMVYCAFVGYGIQAVYYLIVFAIIMVIGIFFAKKKA